MAMLNVFARIAILFVTTSRAFHWASENFPNRHVLRACSGSNVSFPWFFTLNNGEQVPRVEWYFQPIGNVKYVLAVHQKGSFIVTPYARREVIFLHDAGIQLTNVSLSDVGTYDVAVYLNNGRMELRMATLTVSSIDFPVLINGRVTSRLLNKPMVTALTGKVSPAVACGKFGGTRHPFIDMKLKMPNGVILSDLYYTEGESIFKLLEPLDEGNYTCYWDVDDACRSRLGDWVTESVLYVHKFQIHQILQEG